MNGSIKTSPLSLAKLAANAANLIYIRKTGNCYQTAEGSFIKTGGGYSPPETLVDVGVDYWVESRLERPLQRLHPCRGVISKMNPDANRNLFKSEGVHENDLKALEDEPSFKWEWASIEQAVRSLNDRNKRAIKVLLVPTTDNVKEYLVESVGFSKECVDGLSHDQLKLKTDEILKSALIEVGILDTDNSKEFSSDELEPIASHVQTILDFPKQKKEIFAEQTTKEFLESFFYALDKIDYKIEVLRNPQYPDLGMKDLPLKEAVLGEILNGAKNNAIPESLLDAMPNGWKEECLFTLARNDTSKTFQRLLDKCSIDAIYQQSTILSHVIRNNQPEILKILLQHKDIDKIINISDRDNAMPLCQTINELYDKKSFDTMEKLLQAGADGILECDDNNVATTVWHTSDLSPGCANQEHRVYEELVNILLCYDKAKQLINDPSQKGETALHKAIRYCKPETVGKIIDNGASVQYINPQTGENALHFARSAELVELLIKNGAEIHIESIDFKGDTPLHSAVRSGRLGAVKALLQNCANINAINDQTGESVLHMVPLRSLDSLEMLKLLLDSIAQEVINRPDSEGKFPLHKTLKTDSVSNDRELKDQNQVEMMRELLDHGARGDIVDSQTGENIWHLAIRQAADAVRNWPGNISKIVKMFDVLDNSDAKVKINAPNHHGESPLSVAVSLINGMTNENESKKFLPIIKKLVNLGAIIAKSVDNTN